MSNQNAEQRARDVIDTMLTASGWVVQPYRAINLGAAPGIAVCEFPMERGYGRADYLLYVDRKVLGVIEAKPEGTTLSGVEIQTEQYSRGLPEGIPAHELPLPFLYQSTGQETYFTNLLDPNARAHEVFTFHRPETLRGWLQTSGSVLSDLPRVAESQSPYGAARSLRGRIPHMPPLNTIGMRACQVEAITNLEASIGQGKRRSLVQMQTGSGKTYTAIAQTYRLVKFAKAKRILFLVDRSNLARQTLAEFQQYVAPDDGRKFTELYNVQWLQSNRIDPAATVVITTIQRLYSILKGEPEFDSSLEEETALNGLQALTRDPLPVVYNPELPIETFDVVFTDECHRSIYNLWRQVLEYFDGYLAGLTATPSKLTLGFFHGNLVMEYGHARAVADGVNVDFDVYRIQTKITEQGLTVEAKTIVDRRNRKSRRVRWEEATDDQTYRPNELDRAVVAPDQIRTIIRAFKDKMLPECFPGRTHVPKTLTFAKDDSHAEDIVRIVREEFGKGNEFCEKITYQSGIHRVVDPETGETSYTRTNLSAETLLSSFKNAYYPRIAVTVDMIATGTDVKPLEIVFFMRDVRSENYFEQMKGRGCRVLTSTEFQRVTPDARDKLRYVLVDAVGVTEHGFESSPPLERQPSVPLRTLLTAVAAGNVAEDIVSSLASRLARLDRLMAHRVKAQVEDLMDRSLASVVDGLIRSVDPDAIEAEAQARGLALDPASPQGLRELAEVAEEMRQAAVQPLDGAETRELLIRAMTDSEQTIVPTAIDDLIHAGASAEATEKARNTITSFREYLEQNRDEITAIQMLYTRRAGQSPTLRDLKKLAEAIATPPRNWTPEGLWRAYAMLEQSKVRGDGGKMVTDLVSLVRFTLEQEEELAPFRVSVETRFERWLAEQATLGRRFTDEQLGWLGMMKDHIAASIQIHPSDFELSPFINEGGMGRAWAVFGDELDKVMKELNEVLMA